MNMGRPYGRDRPDLNAFPRVPLPYQGIHRVGGTEYQA
jgi:hypothetical protein